MTISAVYLGFYLLSSQSTPFRRRQEGQKVVLNLSELWTCLAMWRWRAFQWFEVRLWFVLLIFKFLTVCRYIRIIIVCTEQSDQANVLLVLFLFIIALTVFTSANVLGTIALSGLHPHLCITDKTLALSHSSIHSVFCIFDWNPIRIPSQWRATLPELSTVTNMQMNSMNIGASRSFPSLHCLHWTILILYSSAYPIHVSGTWFFPKISQRRFPKGNYWQKQSGVPLVFSNHVDGITMLFIGKNPAIEWLNCLLIIPAVSNKTCFRPLHNTDLNRISFFSVVHWEQTHKRAV